MPDSTFNQEAASGNFVSTEFREDGEPGIWFSSFLRCGVLSSPLETPVASPRNANPEEITTFLRDSIIGFLKKIAWHNAIGLPEKSLLDYSVVIHIGKRRNGQYILGNSDLASSFGSQMDIKMLCQSVCVLFFCVFHRYHRTASFCQQGDFSFVGIEDANLIPAHLKNHLAVRKLRGIVNGPGCKRSFQRKF
jgi:hypothetical protein